MIGTPFPSGEPAADRRASFAETLAHLGDLPGAVEALKAALDLAPTWAAGWFRLGEYLEGLNETAAAVDAWTRAVAADPSDPLGASLRRDLACKTPMIETMPPAFVELLFDQYAPRFDTSLTQKLAYRGPQILIDALSAAETPHADRALDLGCGTGLMGAQLRSRCDWLEGYDLSANMLAEAQAKGDYDALHKCDIGALDLQPRSWDLITAADVFIYLGALEQIIGWCAGSLRPGGTLAFTVELDEQAPFTLRDSRRFAHSSAYVQDLLQQAGLAPLSVQQCTLRHDRGQPVASACFVARAVPGTRLIHDGDEMDALA
ncbi:methyltransferase domain-containing protein [Tropicibacter oceani]|uniref:Methyltransferase domain-containing protein n=1 Tax=Tropicibacter oceani TaxID=3058420 RepID=A0ABY8QG80_9RHOB|nr:methyltransferase domain-containing protein [Tropicibacter oceani]WGW03535.1 methyltransferase domain-containing protein [Tropicibacter oceani]